MKFNLKNLLPNFDELAKEFPAYQLSGLAGVWIERAKENVASFEKELREKLTELENYRGFTRPIAQAVADELKEILGEIE